MQSQSNIHLLQLTIDSFPGCVSVLYFLSQFGKN